MVYRVIETNDSSEELIQESEKQKLELENAGYNLQRTQVAGLGKFRLTYVKQTYDVQNVLDAQCNLTPIKCRKCGDFKEVTFDQSIGDAHCAVCGEWQLDIKLKNS